MAANDDVGGVLDPIVGKALAESGGVWATDKADHGCRATAPRALARDLHVIPDKPYLHFTRSGPDRAYLSHCIYRRLINAVFWIFLTYLYF